MVGKILIPEIRSLIGARDFAGLRELFSDWPPADVAEVIVDMPQDERVIIFRVLPAALAADVFEYLDVEAQQELLRSMAREQVVVGVVLWGTLSGSMLPFLLRRVGADPATSSAPFVATLVDVTGLVIYFSIALIIMRGAML
jgi:Mg/Co/Ni transporter MgtE